MAKKVAKHPRGNVSDLVRGMSGEINPENLSYEACFRIVLAINEQAVKDADRILKEMRTHENNMLKQLELRDALVEDIFPLFCNNFLPNLTGRKMMENVIYQRMRKDNLKEMPEIWRDQLRAIDEMESYLLCN